MLAGKRDSRRHSTTGFSIRELSFRFYDYDYEIFLIPSSAMRTHEPTSGWRDSRR